MEVIPDAVDVVKGHDFAYVNATGKVIYTDRCGYCEKDLPTYPHCNYCPFCGVLLYYNKNREWTL